MDIHTDPERRRSSRGIALLVGVGTVLIGLVIAVIPQDLERQFGLPMLYRMRGPLPPPGDVVIVAMEQGTARNLGISPNYNRWPRQYHARLVDNLRRAGARLIVFDVDFSERSPQLQGDTEALAEAMKAAGNVIITSSVADHGDALSATVPSDAIPVLKPRDTSAEDAMVIRRCSVPAPLLSGAALGVGPFVVPPQSERIDVFWTYNALPCAMPTLPVVALQADLRTLWPVFVEVLKSSDPAGAALYESLPAIGGHTMTVLRERFRERPDLRQRLASELGSAIAEGRIATADGQRLSALIDLYGGQEARYLNFFGPALSLPTIAMSDAIDAERDGATWQAFQSRLRGKVVFIGASELSIEDQKNSMDAFDTVYIDAGGLRLQGVEIAATAFANLAAGSDLRRAPPINQIAILLGTGLWLALVWSRLRLWPAAVVTGISVAVYVTIAALRFRTSMHWDVIVAPLLMAVSSGALAALGRYIMLLRERQSVIRAVQRRLPKSVAREFLLTGQVNRAVSGVCLISDLGNWTRMVGQHNESTLSDIMRGYLDRVFDSVEGRAGYPVDAAGDGVLAIWIDEQGTPLQRRRAACEAALAIVGHDDAAGLRGAGVRTRIGLSGGEMALRDIGGESQFQLKVFGMTVNVASRIEGLNKSLGTRILATTELADGLDEFLWRSLGRFQVDGIDAPVSVSELVGRLGEVSSGARGVCAMFESAMQAYRSSQFESARELLTEVLEMDRSDGPAAFYLEWLAMHDRIGATPDGEAPIRIGKAGVIAPAARPAREAAR